MHTGFALWYTAKEKPREQEMAEARSREGGGAMISENINSSTSDSLFRLEIMWARPEDDGVFE